MGCRAQIVPASYQITRNFNVCSCYAATPARRPCNLPWQPGYTLSLEICEIWWGRRLRLLVVPPVYLGSWRPCTSPSLSRPGPAALLDTGQGRVRPPPTHGCWVGGCVFPYCYCTCVLRIVLAWAGLPRANSSEAFDLRPSFLSLTQLAHLTLFLASPPNLFFQDPSSLVTRFFSPSHPQLLADHPEEVVSTSLFSSSLSFFVRLVVTRKRDQTYHDSVF